MAHLGGKHSTSKPRWSRLGVRGLSLPDRNVSKRGNVQSNGTSSIVGTAYANGVRDALILTKLLGQ